MKGSRGPSNTVTSIFYFKIMEKCYFDKIREQVRLSVKELLNPEKNGSEVTIGNIKLKFYMSDDPDRPLPAHIKYNPLNYTIEVSKYGRCLDLFSVCFYAQDHWGLISKPWIYDFTNDIASVVIDNIDIKYLVTMDI